MPDRPEHQPLSALFKQAWASMSEVGSQLLGDPQERALDAQLRENDEALSQCRAELASCRAQRLVTDERVAELGASIRAGEAQCASLLQRRRKSAAEAAALEVAKLQLRWQQEKHYLAELEAQCAKLRGLIETGEDNVRRLKQSLGLLRTSRNLRQAQAAIATEQPDGVQHPESAVEALKRRKAESEDAPAAAPKPRAAAPAQDAAALAKVLLQKLAGRGVQAGTQTASTSDATAPDAPSTPVTKKAAAKKLAAKKAAVRKTATKKTATKKAAAKKAIGKKAAAKTSAAKKSETKPSTRTTRQR